jgi:hypothetical protein
MKKLMIRLLILILGIIVVYGFGRLYYHLTGGFTKSNIQSDFSYQPQWEVRPLLPQEEGELSKALGQNYFYLGKGCQSYVFESEDHQYVIKFFKYQRYRLQPWLAWFPPLPSIVKYREEKKEKKWKKLDGFVKSWKVAFENLKEETGLLYVHLNKTTDLEHQLTIYDKIGKAHLIDLDQMEFCIQRKAQLLCSELLKFKEEENLTQARVMIHQLLTLILSEYSRGLADNDHALMQNTGVAQGKPIHIDVGQFVMSEKVKEPQVYHQELFTKTYKFKLWLRDHYPELGSYLETELRQIIGSSYDTMQPKFRKK